MNYWKWFNLLRKDETVSSEITDSMVDAQTVIKNAMAKTLADIVADAMDKINQTQKPKQQRRRRNGHIPRSPTDPTLAKEAASYISMPVLDLSAFSNPINSSHPNCRCDVVGERGNLSAEDRTAFFEQAIGDLKSYGFTKDEAEQLFAASLVDAPRGLQTAPVAGLGISLMVLSVDDTVDVPNIERSRIRATTEFSEYVPEIFVDKADLINVDITNHATTYISHSGRQMTVKGPSERTVVFVMDRRRRQTLGILPGVVIQVDLSSLGLGLV